MKFSIRGRYGAKSTPARERTPRRPRWMDRTSEDPNRVIIYSAPGETDGEVS